MYAIRLDNQPIWFYNGKEETFDTEQEAEQALIEEMKSCELAHQAGYMDDEGDFSDYRIVKAK